MTLVNRIKKLELVAEPPPLPDTNPLYSLTQAQLEEYGYELDNTTLARAYKEEGWAKVCEDFNNDPRWESIRAWCIQHPIPHPDFESMDAEHLKLYTERLDQVTLMQAKSIKRERAQEQEQEQVKKGEEYEGNDQ